MVLAHTRVVALTVALLVVASTAQAAEWNPPKDEVFTEKQLTSYFQVQKEALDNWKAAGKAVEGSQSTALAMGVYLRTDERFKTSLAKHGMSLDEYSWVGGRVWEAWGTIILEQIAQQMQKQFADQKKANDQKLGDLRQKLAAYEKAQKDGRQVLSKEERERAIQSAKDEQQSALEEAKQHADEARQAHEDATKADKDSDAAKDARDKEAEAKKAETESRAKAAAAAKRIADPDLPVTDEEKSEAKKRNDDQIASLKTDIESTGQVAKLLQETGDSSIKSFQAQGQTTKVPPQNLEVLKKHGKEFEDMWGIKDTGTK